MIPARPTEILFQSAYFVARKRPPTTGWSLGCSLRAQRTAAVSEMQEHFPTGRNYFIPSNSRFKSSGIGIDFNAITLAPPVLPNGTQILLKIRAATTRTH